MRGQGGQGYLRENRKEKKGVVAIQLHLESGKRPRPKRRKEVQIVAFDLTLPNIGKKHGGAGQHKHAQVKKANRNAKQEKKITAVRRAETSGEGRETWQVGKKKKTSRKRNYGQEVV